MESSPVFKQIIQFFSLDVRSLALFRIGLAGVLIADLALRSRDLTAHYSDGGVLPAGNLLSEFLHPWEWSLHFINGQPLFQALLFLVAAIVAVALGVGYQTRLATIFSWALLASLHNRNWMVLNAGDTELRMLLFWAMFLPLGAVYSVDAALDRQAPARGTRFCSAASIALILQVCFVYWFAALLKDNPIWWQENSATYYALSLDYMTTNLGKFLLNFPALLVVATWLTVRIELWGPFLLFSPFKSEHCRLGAVLLFCGLHIGFASGLNLSLFPFIAVTAWLALLPSLAWQGIGRWLGAGDGAGLTLLHPAGRAEVLKGLHLLRTFLGLPQATLVVWSPTVAATLPPGTGWAVQTPNGEIHGGFGAIALLASQSPILKPVRFLGGWLPLRAGGDRLYAWLVNHHQGLLSWLPPLRFKARDRRLSLSQESFVIVALLVVIGWNFHSLSPKTFPVPSEVQAFSRAFGLIQSWNMFAPTPSTNDGWYVIPGTLANGAAVDVYRDGAPVTWDRPANLAATYDGQRWRKYLERIHPKDYEAYRLYYGRYLCRDWNQRHPEGEALVTFDIYFMLEATQPDYQPPKLEKIHLWQHDCTAPTAE